MNSEENEYPNTPPKGIQNAIWGACFQYQDFDTIVEGVSVRDRIYDCWNRIHFSIKNDPNFQAWIDNHEPDIK